MCSQSIDKVLELVALSELDQMLVQLQVPEYEGNLLVTREKLQMLCAAVTERAAVAAWSQGMDMHQKHKLSHDSREVGSMCAQRIRAGAMK